MTFLGASHSKAPQFPSHMEWERSALRWIFKNLVQRGRLRVDFLALPSFEVGDGTGPLLAISAPRIWDMLHILTRPGLRMGTSYMEGKWAVTDGKLSDLIFLLENQESPYLRGYRWIHDIPSPIFIFWQYPAVAIGRLRCARHYNIPPDFYRHFLDREMVYSCAFFTSQDDSLESAQDRKLSTTLERLGIQPGMRVLDIGCGWGALTRRMARLGAKVTGITLADNQRQWCVKSAQESGLDIEYHCADYTKYLASHTDEFDRIVSVGMFEHVGKGRHVEFFRRLHTALNTEGLALVHTIVRPYPGKTNAWMDRYIFPNGYQPSIGETVKAIEKSGLDLAQVFVHEGGNYKRTLQLWEKNLAEWHPSTDVEIGFLRMWDFYLSAAQNMFERKSANNKVCQFLVRKITGNSPRDIAPFTAPGY